MEQDFWLRRWNKGDIGFHRDAIHAYLKQNWPSLKLGSGATVFVPLCGKARDMIWLAEQGYKVVGVELSPIAVADFFAEHNLSPDLRNDGPFTISTYGAFEIWCGDIFDLPSHVWQRIDGVYDRASLVAFPPQLQEKYADLLGEHLPSKAPIFLISLSYDPTEITGPPFSVTDQAIQQLFETNFDIAHVTSRDGMDDNKNLRERGLSALQESLYVLKKR
ncbi:MAG: thiopurine S-methyltransferase [Hyphomicrobiaceae bacterium]